MKVELFGQRCCLCLEKEGRSIQAKEHRLCGDFSASGAENLVKVEGIMKEEGYVKIMKENLQQQNRVWIVALLSNTT